MGIKSEAFPAAPIRTSITYPMLARGGETGSIYLMQSPSGGVCILSKGGIPLGSIQTAGSFIPLSPGEAIVLTQTR